MQVVSDLLMCSKHVTMYMPNNYYVGGRTLGYLLHPMAADSLGAQLAVLLKVHP